MADIATRLAEVRERVAAAARGAGRDPGAVTLVAVSKEVGAAAVVEAAAAGQHHFGENRAQELRAKVDALEAAADSLVWHFIGRLQRNKVRSIAAFGRRCGTPSTVRRSARSLPAMHPAHAY